MSSWPAKTRAVRKLQSLALSRRRKCALSSCVLEANPPFWALNLCSRQALYDPVVKEYEIPCIHKGV